MCKLNDLTGQYFGKLTVIERAPNHKSGLAMWKCLCDCGSHIIVRGTSLRSGNTRSCGCLHKEMLADRNRVHGLRNTRLYAVWLGIKERCYNPNHKRYNRYGGRGVSVCDEWLNDFYAFYAWAMENGYDENAPFGQCTIDRIDNDKGYSPDNCRWADQKIQQNNRSNNKKE